MRPEVHARAAMTAAAQGKSLGAWAAEIIDRETL
ncbi:toxin-antitoxin system HicB family antitoxin [Desulfolutivibrio sulfoxidireducens]|nr:toxin-antitoxin system HicB family antitoxin [Desulfolutivibrio sulfoxidireducens]QLA17002.1 toxin-antitoxin system HicB family antitoxin [Desulfolutivibrio sulfoxidireducens]QLA20569.1 toxin-antitoxin system HicB family antitoxin [Desulfolutivibrio sulfoxidireducens]